jgi:hypothetical protein
MKGLYEGKKNCMKEGRKGRKERKEGKEGRKGKEERKGRKEGLYEGRKEVRTI